MKQKHYREALKRKVCKVILANNTQKALQQTFKLPDIHRNIKKRKHKLALGHELHVAQKCTVKQSPNKII